MTDIDHRLYLVTSGTDRHTVDAATAAARAGAGIVQVRAKEAPTRDLLALTREIARAVAAAAPRTRVVVDDSVEVAHALRLTGEPVHGVHLGQDDLPPRLARQILGPDALIGLTTGTLDLVREADELAGVVDYLGAGPYRLTPTKDSGRAALGVEGYRPLVAATSLPIVAIGDITVADVAALAGTGIAGVCVVRAVMGAPDPGRVAAALLAAWQDARPAGTSR